MSLYQEVTRLNLRCHRCKKITEFFILARRRKHLVKKCSRCGRFGMKDYKFTPENLNFLIEKSQNNK